MTIQITLTHGKLSQASAKAGGLRKDICTAEWDGKAFQVELFRPVVGICRELVEAGCPDQPFEVFLDDGTRSLHGPSIVRVAAPALAAVIDQSRAEQANAGFT